MAASIATAAVITIVVNVFIAFSDSSSSDMFGACTGHNSIPRERSDDATRHDSSDLH